VFLAVIKGHQVEITERYRYLGSVFEDKLHFEKNTDIIRGQIF